MKYGYLCEEFDSNDGQFFDFQIAIISSFVTKSFWYTWNCRIS